MLIEAGENHLSLVELNAVFHGGRKVWSCKLRAELHHVPTSDRVPWVKILPLKFGFLLDRGKQNGSIQ